MSDRGEILRAIEGRVRGRPVRWTDERTSLGDWDGREWTLDVFDTPSHEQRAIFSQVWPFVKEVRKKQGIHLTIVFHTPEATEKYYAWVRAEPAATSDEPTPPFRRPGPYRDFVHTPLTDARG